MYSFQNSAVSNIPSIPESTVSNKILLEEYDVVENCLDHFKCCITQIWFLLPLYNPDNIYLEKSPKKICALIGCVYLTNRFHVAVHLFSNRSQMTSKCGKKKKVAHEASRVCHWCSYHVLASSVIYHWIRRMAKWNLFVLYNNDKPFFILKYFNITRKPAFAPPGFCPPLSRTQKSHLTWSMIYTKWSNFIGYYA